MYLLGELPPDARTSALARSWHEFLPSNHYQLGNILTPFRIIWFSSPGIQREAKLEAGPHCAPYRHFFKTRSEIHQQWESGKRVFLLSRDRLRTLQLWASSAAIIFVLYSPVSLNFSETLYRQSTVFLPQLLLVFCAFQRHGGNSFSTPSLLVVEVQLLLGVNDFFPFLDASLKGNKRDLLAHWAVEINPLHHYMWGRKINHKPEWSCTRRSW